MKFPVIFWQENIVFDDKRRAYAVYKLPLINYSLLSVSDKISAMYNLRELVYNTHGEYTVLSLCREFAVESYAQQLTNLRYDDKYLSQEFNEHIQATHHGLSDRKPWNRQIFVLRQIPLKNMLAQIKSIQYVRSHFKDILTTLIDMFSTTDPYITEHILEAAMIQEDNIYNEIREGMRGERATSPDIEWIIKHNLFRSLGEPEISTNWKPASVVEVTGIGNKLKPMKNEIISHIDDCYMYEGLDHLKITHVEGPYKGKESYQALLAMSNYPESIRFPGAEFYQWLEDLDFPVDISIKLHSFDSKHAQMKLSGKLKELQDQKQQHMYSTTGVPLHVHDNEMKGMELESKIKSGMPLLEVTSIFCVAAPHKEELEKRVETVMNIYRPRQFKLVRTPGDQRKFHSTFIPGADVKLKEHTVAMDPEMFATGMMTATRQIGDPMGFYLGDNISGSQTPVFMYPMRGPKFLNRSAALGILGTLGGGKSVTRKYILYAAMTVWGAKVISIDPKDEDACFSLIPEIAANMKQVDLGPGSTVTINPYHISQSEEDVRSIVTDLLFMLLNAESDDKEVRQMAIHEAIGIVMQLPYKQRNMKETIKAFNVVKSDSNVNARIKEEAENCALLLEAFMKLNFSRLLFSEESNIDAAAQMTVFNFAGLPLPADKNSKMSNSEKFGSAILFLVTQFARQILIGKQYRDTLKILSIDEAWKMMMTPEGVRLITEIIRMGRSMGIMPIIATQNANDLSSTDIRNNLGMIMMFRNPDMTEITECLEMIGLDKDDDALKQRIPQFISGQCIFRDIEGRIGEMFVRPRPGKLLKVFNTSVR